MSNRLTIEKFKMYYPTMAEQAVSYKAKGPNIIFVTLEDGSVIEYNDVLTSFRTVHPYDGSEESWKREFAHRLVEKMVDRGFDQIYLSEISGVSHQSISNYIHRKTIPTAYAVDKLARALRCDVSDLTGF